MLLRIPSWFVGLTSKVPLFTSPMSGLSLLRRSRCVLWRCRQSSLGQQLHSFFNRNVRYSRLRIDPAVRIQNFFFLQTPAGQLVSLVGLETRLGKLVSVLGRGLARVGVHCLDQRILR